MGCLEAPQNGHGRGWRGDWWRDEAGTHNYNYSCASAPTATAPAAAPAATAPPSSEAQQLVDVKAMFEQGLIPSREIYEAKVLQILGLPRMRYVLPARASMALLPWHASVAGT